ncbi:hypothetical protein GCM10010245_69940 [Streptomyces spectabilis]|nr:hypothetical protein CP982_15925 [Streptomyces spectabilis]GGV44681.1 hypothetical protein GCM10010245_69940 [Streptomyces spectabilis]
MSCWTCGTTEPHRPLTEPQKAWLSAEIDEDFVDHYWMCARPGCRNVRTFMTERRFRKKPLRIPPDVE